MTETTPNPSSLTVEDAAPDPPPPISSFSCSSSSSSSPIDADLDLLEEEGHPLKRLLLLLGEMFSLKLVFVCVVDCVVACDDERIIVVSVEAPSGAPHEPGIQGRGRVVDDGRGGGEDVSVQQHFLFAGGHQS